MTTDPIRQDERTCGTCGKHKCGDSPQSVLSNGNEVNCQDWTKKTIELSRNKPQPQGAPTPLDILAVLADFIPKINQTCDQLHAKSLVLEDDYCKAGNKANAIFDLCGELQADYAEIVNEEPEEPNAPKVPMDYNG